MNIIQKLKNSNVSFQLSYYGQDDLSTSWAVKSLIENKEIIEKYFNKKNKQNLHSSDDYIDYLFLLTTSKYIEIIEIVRENIKADFQNLLNYLLLIFNNYKIKDLINFLKDNYKQIMLEKYEKLLIRSDVIDYTISFLITYKNSFDNDMLKFLIQDFSYKIYDNFDNFKNLFNKSKKLEFYDLLLTKEKLQEDMNYRLEKIEKVLVSLKSKDEKKYNEKVEIITNIVEERSFSSKVDNVMDTYHDIQGIIKLLKNLNHPLTYKFVSEFKKQEKLLDEHLEKNGHSTQIEINIKQYVEFFENKEKDWSIKSLLITHGKDKLNPKDIISNLEYTIKYFEISQLEDLFSSNKNTDDLFTFSVLNNLSITMLQGKYTINYLISDAERLKEIMSYIYAGVSNYFAQSKLNADDLKFDLDLDILHNAIIDYLNKLKNKEYDKFIIYGIVMLVCALIEKILRYVYLDKTMDMKYVNIKNMPLCSLLKSQEVISALGYLNAECLELFLLDRNGVGNNLRNNFAHFNEEIYDKIHYDSVLEVIYLLIFVTNNLLINNTKIK